MARAGIRTRTGAELSECAEHSPAQRARGRQAPQRRTAQPSPNPPLSARFVEIASPQGSHFSWHARGFEPVRAQLSLYRQVSATATPLRQIPPDNKRPARFSPGWKHDLASVPSDFRGPASLPSVFRGETAPSALKLPATDGGAFLPSGFSPMRPCRPQSCRQEPALVRTRYSSRTRAAKAADSSTNSSRRSTRSEPFHHRSMLRTTPPAAKSARSTRSAAAGALPCR